MSHVLRNSRPSTYIFKLFENADRFTLYDDKGRIYFYRYIPTGHKSIKVNVPDAGNYYYNQNAEVMVKPLEIRSEVNRIRLPRPERRRDKDYFIEHNPSETNGSPAIIYTHLGKIVTGGNFKDMPCPMRVFILLHEIGHFKYETEKYCDLYATIEFIKMGYNPSAAIYCLTDYLKEKPQNDERIAYVFDNLKKAGLIG